MTNLGETRIGLSVRRAKLQLTSARRERGLTRDKSHPNPAVVSEARIAQRRAESPTRLVNVVEQLGKNAVETANSSFADMTTGGQL